MANDPRRHVRPGQPIAIAAEQINWLNSQMRGDTGFSFERGPVAIATNWIYAKATQQLQARQIAFIYPSQTPTIDLDLQDEQQRSAVRRQYHSAPVVNDLRATPPSNAQLYGLHHICMTLEPASVGDIIKIQVSGPVYVHIQMNHRYHGYCRWVAPTGSSYHNGFADVPLVLSSATAGPARIVWFDERNYNGPTRAGSSNAPIVPAVVVL